MRRLIILTIVFYPLIFLSPSPGHTQTGILIVESSPPGAQIYLNGAFKGIAPYEEMFIAVGSYRLEVLQEGYKVFRKEIIINEIDPVLIKVTFKKARWQFGGEYEEYTIEAEKGNVVIASIPSGAEVYVDGEKIEQVTPFSRRSVDVGRYSIRAAIAGKDIKGSIDVAREETTKVVFDFGRGKMIDERLETIREKEEQARISREEEERKVRELKERQAKELAEKKAREIIKRRELEDNRKRSVQERTETLRKELDKPEGQDDPSLIKVERERQEIDKVLLEEKRRGIAEKPVADASCLTEDCHQSMKKDFQKANSVHSPVSKELCLSCHVSHESDEDIYDPQLKKFLADEYYLDFDISNYDLCWECHLKTMILTKETSSLTSFRNGKSNLHYAHVNLRKSRSCKVCHNPHFANQMNNIRDTVPFGREGWFLSIQYNKTLNGGSCVTGCHREWAYDRESPVIN